MSNGKFYWLKLQKDFFKTSKMKIILSLPNGKEFALLYMQMLLESVDHNGELKLEDDLPYTKELLAVVTNTKLETVQKAIEKFEEYKMLDVNDEGVFVMREVESMTGSASDNANANRQRRHREAKKTENTDSVVTNDNDDVTGSVTKCHTMRYKMSHDALQNVTGGVTNDNESKSKSKNKSIDIDIEKDIKKENDISPNVDISLEKENEPKKKKFIPPTIEEVRAYCLEKGYDIDAEHFINFYESKGWYVGKNKMVSWKACVGTWVKNNKKQQTKVISDNPYEDMLREEGIYYDENRSNYFIE